MLSHFRYLCHSRYYRLVAFLLEANAQTEQRNDDWTPLMWASQGGHANCVELLLRAGADVNVRVFDDAADYTPLIEAAYWGRLGVVKLLLDAAAEVDAATANGCTALFMAGVTAAGLRTCA